MIKLVKLSKKYKKQFTDMMDEWTSYNETIIPYSLTKINYHYFDLFIEKTEIMEYNKTRVPSHLYFCLDTVRNIFIGAVVIRTTLTNDLLIRGGHIADGVRPSERNKGFGNILIFLALEKCKEIGLKKVLIVCDKNNIPSSKAIIKNKGILENEIQIDNQIIQRYWVTI